MKKPKRNSVSFFIYQSHNKVLAARCPFFSAELVQAFKDFETDKIAGQTETFEGQKYENVLSFIRMITN